MALTFKDPFGSRGFKLSTSKLLVTGRISTDFSVVVVVIVGVVLVKSPPFISTDLGRMSAGNNLKYNDVQIVG